MSKKKTVTPKSLGLIPGTKLSTRYANNKNHYKVVEDQVLGFMVFGDDRNGYQITEMLSATIFTRYGKTRHMALSWEYGDSLVGRPDHPDGKHDNYIASAILRLLTMLQDRASQRKRFDAHVKKKKR